MIRIKDQKQQDIFDPWNYLSPKRLVMLQDSWAGLFKENVLESLPVVEFSTHFNSTFGRPTKELHTVLGVLFLQQAFDLTDQETVQQFAFNIQWHYALNITEESDSAKYLSLKTLWSSRTLVAEKGLEQIIFDAVTQRLADVFKVDTKSQRLDSVHIKSNMRRLGRICIFSETIHRFMRDLKISHPVQLEKIDPHLIERYLSEKAIECFSRVKPSESQNTLDSVAKELFSLVTLFKSVDTINTLESYRLLERVLSEQCNLTENKETPVEIKKPKEISSSSLQNPSDPDASYSGHKGQGFQVQVMETFTEDKDDKTLNLITYVHVEPAHNSDSNALIPAIESVKEKDLLPGKLLADSLYGSDENVQKAEKDGVELIAPTMGAPKEGNLSLSDFTLSDKDQVVSCPAGHAPKKTKKKKGAFSAAFNSQVCTNCPLREHCPTKEGKSFHYLRYKEKELRIARRRTFEETEEFKDSYRYRSGVEATMSEYSRRTGVKRLRVRKLIAVRFCAVLKALGVNLFRATAVRGRKNSPDKGESTSGTLIYRLFLFLKEQVGINERNFYFDSFPYSKFASLG